jgi:hypothetical protein
MRKPGKQGKDLWWEGDWFALNITCLGKTEPGAKFTCFIRCCDLKGVRREKD